MKDPFPSDADAPLADAATRARVWERVQSTIAVAPAVPATPIAAATTTKLAAGKLVAAVLAVTVAGATATTAVIISRDRPTPAPVEEVRRDTPGPGPTPVLIPEPTREREPERDRDRAREREREHERDRAHEPERDREPERERERERDRLREPQPDRLSLSDERRLVDRAAAALEANDVPQALGVIAAHERAAPSGHLAEEREALRVRALVRAGNLAEAREHAERFLARWPRSILRPSVEAAIK